MTMAVGFACKDGIVIGSDRQVTGANYTFPECKLDVIDWKNGRCIYAYSGNRDTYNVFRKEMWSRFGVADQLTHPDVERMLGESLEASLGRKEAFFTLFGYMLDSMYPILLMSAGKRITTVNECEVIGYGDSPLSRFLLGRFKDQPHSASVIQAAIYAVSFIAEAKKYDGQYVGDGTDVYVLERNSGNAPRGQIQVIDAGQTHGWEQQIATMNYWMDALFSHVTDKNNPVPMDQFMERLQAFRKWVGGDPIKQ